MVQGMSRDASDEFSKTILVRYVISYLCGTLYLDPSASLRKDLCILCGGSKGGLPAISLAFGRANVGGSTAGFVRNSGYSPLVDVDRSFARFTSTTL